MIGIKKLTTNIGAEVTGVDLAEAARNDDLFGTLKEALLAHKVLFVRDQAICKADHVDFASRFGALEDHPVLGSDPEHPGLVCIYKDLDSPPDFFENAWHCDATFRECPPMGAVLRYVEGPRVGGDTLWANMAKAYEDLPDHVKDTIDGLYARHSIEASFGARMPIEKRHALKAQYPDAEHPPRNRREGAVRQRLCHPFHQFPHGGERPLRAGLRTRRCQPAPASDRAGRHS